MKKIISLIVVWLLYAGILLAQQEQKPPINYFALQARESANWGKRSVLYKCISGHFQQKELSKALEKRIPELKKLGVTVIWLMPIHPWVKSTARALLAVPIQYKITNGINSEFGTLDDFKSLVNAVHQQGLKIIIDLVANHTAWDNPMLTEHPEWYTHDASGKIISPNQDWTDVADLNYDTPELRKYMITMMKYWVHDVVLMDSGVM